MSEINLEDLKNAIGAPETERSGVDFSGKSLKLDTEADTAEIVAAIQNCPRLDFLNLTGNTVGVEAAGALAEGLRSRPELTQALWSDMFTGRMKTEIPKALRALGSGMMDAGARLTVLDLSDNAFGPIGVEGLAALLKSPVCSQLKELRLNNNGLGITGAKLLASALRPAPPHLTTLVMGRNRLENPGAIALASVIQTISNLEVLSIPQNGIYHQGVSALVTALEHNPRLRRLDLNDNTVGPLGAQALGRALPKLSQLTDLNLGDCLLKTKGARALLNAMHGGLPQLKVLNLRFDEIGPMGGELLVREVSARPGLRALLGGNSLGAQAREALRQLGADLRKQDEPSADSDSEEDDDDVEEEEDEEEDEDAESEAGGDSGASSGAEDDSLLATDTTREGLETKDKSPAAMFLENPSRINYEALGGKPQEVLMQHVQTFKDELSYVDCLAAACMSVSGLLEREQAAGLFQQLTSWSSAGAGRQWSTANAVLSHLRLIKSESKRKISWDIEKCLITLSTFIVEPWFPANLRETLRFFVKLKIEDGKMDNAELLKKYPNLWEA